MNIIKRDSEGNTYHYNEGFWTGKKNLTINGEPAKKISKNSFKLSNDVFVTSKGNFVRGVTLNIGGKSVVLCKNNWYDYILMFLPFLCFGIGVFGGAIGGGLSGLIGALGLVFNTYILRTKMNIVLKILCCIGVAVVALFAVCLMFVLIGGGLAAAFPGIFG